MFLEWLEYRRLHEASTMNRQAMAGYQAIADIDEESFYRDKEAGMKYFVITNSIGMMRDLIKAAKSGDKVDPTKYSMFLVSNIQGDQVELVRKTNQTYSSGQNKIVGLGDISEFEITDAIEEMGFSQGKNRYFLSASRKGVAPKLRKMMQKWLELTQHSITGDQEGRQNLAIRGFMGGQDAVKKQLRQGAKDVKDQFWVQLGDRAMRGEDVTKIAADGAYDDMTGHNALESPDFHYKITQIAPALYTQLRLKGLIGEVTPEDKQLMQYLGQINTLVQSNNTDVLRGNPEVDQIIQNPNSIMYATVMGLRGAAQWLKSQDQTGDFWARLSQANATSQPPEAMTPSPLDALMAGESTLYENICWKMHKDQKLYNYYE